MSGLPKSTDSTYKDLMKKDKVVIFKMSAVWCNPCKEATRVCLSSSLIVPVTESLDE